MRKLWPACIIVALLAAEVLAGSTTQHSASLSSLPVAATTLQSLVWSGHLQEMRWPDFSDYRNDVQVLYEQSGFAPIWTSSGKPTPQALAVLSILRSADQKGLQPEDYDEARLAAVADRFAVSGAASDDDLARFDLGLTVSLMRYISDIHCGRVNPRHVSFALEAKRFESTKFIRFQLLHSGDVAAALNSLEPPFDGYRRTEAALIKYLALARQGDGPRLPPFCQNVKPGQSYSGMQALAARLVLFGDLAAEAASRVEGDAYNGEMVTAVKHFQARHGLAATGILDGATYRALIVPLAQRILQLQLTLERWRWLRVNILPAIVVNIPEFELRVYGADHRVVLSMPAIVGRAYRYHTPVFEDTLDHIIVRPYWNVPLSIVRKEIVPAIRKDAGYPAKQDFEVVDRSGQLVESTPEPSELLQMLSSGELQVRQRPGSKNALGLLKFDFPNTYDVYMHGTPEQQLFSRSRRDFSHGCIRVQDPLSLATWVLQDDPTWTRERLAAAMNGMETIEIRARPITVLILYGTAIVDETGQAHFFEDLYGHDAELQQALAKGYPYSRNN
jgi:murein L,D-transpeptidase YcbB/YkuD